MTTEELLWEAFMVLLNQSPRTGEVADMIWKIQVEGPWENQPKRLIRAGVMDKAGHPILTG